MIAFSALRSALVRPGPSLSFGGSSNLLEAPPKPQIISRPKVPMLDRDIFHKFEQKKALQRSFEVTQFFENTVKVSSVINNIVSTQLE